MSRTTTRAANARKTVYTPPNLLGIPDALKAWARSNGMHLRWVRWQIEGQDDVRNLTKRKNEGYTLVKESEIPEHIRGEMDVGRTGRSEGILINGDVALAQVPVELAEARREYYEEQHNMQEEALNADLLQTPGLSDRGRRATPVQSNLKSRTTTGRKPAIGAISKED